MIRRTVVLVVILIAVLELASAASMADAGTVPVPAVRVADEGRLRWRDGMLMPLLPLLCFAACVAGTAYGFRLFRIPRYGPETLGYCVAVMVVTMAVTLPVVFWSADR